MKNPDKEIIYQLDVSDLQKIATEFLERRLTKEEVALVRDSVGDFIDWDQAIKYAIQRHIDTSLIA